MEIGIDIIELNRFEITDNWLSRILSKKELKEFNNLKNTWSNTRIREYLAGRWCCKEAIIKAINEKPSFTKLVIIQSNNKLRCHYKNWNIKLSISHNKTCVVAVALAKQLGEIA